MFEGSWTIEPCSRDDVRRLADALEIGETTAAVLVRRGYGEPESARNFLEGALPAHDPFLLGAMEVACRSIRRAIAGGKRICVHGDYDADGICATALAVFGLRELGADVTWHLPSRFEEGYGVSDDTLSRLAEEGCALVVTVDCGITAVEEVEHAKSLGLEIVVTDHHRPGETLPDCPIVATRPSSYPFPELCGTGVVYKLLQALGVPAERHVDLAAVATVADVVPLLDENRGLVLAGLRALGTTQKPGLRELMRVSRVDPATVDTGSIGFRIAPRLNAAGRLCKPEAALELLLTENKEKAARLAGELEELNRDRQMIEERILREATEEIEGWTDAARRRRAYVLAREDWHEGVIGIVASRLVERYNRPVVLIAGTDGHWKGSGRSISGFDLHDGLQHCTDELERHGGHAAAAGLSVRPERIEGFRERFVSLADATLTDDALVPRISVDALVHGHELTLDLCAELSRLAPFGLGNPNVTLLLAGCELAELVTVGDGKHLRFRVKAGARDAGSAIAFGQGRQLDRLRRVGAYDVAFRLEENHWNGTVAPQLVVKRVFDANPRYGDLREWLKAEWRKPAAERSTEAQAIFAELGLAEGAAPAHLVDSPTFRGLLNKAPLAEAA
jgi:single-stranded-DNA-specific exonuclease